MAPAVPVLLALALAAEAPPAAEVMVLGHVPGKLGPVRFTHADHATRHRMPDGSALRCLDCHHGLAAAGAAGPAPEMRCTPCHPPMGQPERVVDGKVARPLARTKPDGAIDVRSVLFHDQCRGCHLRIPSGRLNLATCKVCHPGGLSPEAIHGPHDGPPPAR
ncbi:MAG TPA: hypothetical protein VFM45_10230 [Anaeromyxobacteraceae bacterium]|nr:hypothetical protein [Anaeromyxobacteraceae bacterium]